mgnify:CR=1 FL=1
MSRGLRLGLVLSGVLITAGLAYRAVDDERAIERGQREESATTQSAEDALLALADLRAALHVYSVPGQDLTVWSTRSTRVLDTVRECLLTLDVAGEAFGRSVADSLDGVDQLTASEKRARAYADRGEPLLAADVVFVETRDLLTGTENQVRAARTAINLHRNRLRAGQRREQAAITAGALVLWIAIAVVLLVKPGQVQPARAEWRQELASRLKPAADPRLEPTLSGTPADGPTGDDVAPEIVAEPAISVGALTRVGAICVDMSTVSDLGALAGTLERACDVLGASGVIVWAASGDGASLSPVASHGFDPRMVARIGAIARDSANLTANAFRDNAPQISPATASAPAALSVSLRGPAGPVGVLSAELREGRAVDETCMAVASIFAAQLATLTTPVPVPTAAAAQPASEADDGNPRAAAR